MSEAASHVEQLAEPVAEIERSGGSAAQAPTGPTEAATSSSKRPAPRYIAFMNQKGGVGKTTTTVNIGAALALSGRKVLMIDLDPQAHLTLHLGVEPENLEASVYDLLADENVSALEVVQQVRKRLSLLPAEVNLAGIESELAPAMVTGKAQRMLRQKCQPLLEAEAFDYVLIDCPPSLGLLTINALTLANEVIVPMQPHFLALQGLSKLLETVQLVRQSFNPQLTVAGVVLCMHESQTILAGEVLNDLTNFLEASRGTDVPWANAQLFQPPVRRNIKLAESPSFGKTIFDYAPDCHGASDYRKLAAALVAQQTGKSSA